MSESKRKKCVCIILSKQDYERLFDLAEDVCRTPSGYMRWLLHQHMKELNTEKAPNGKETSQSTNA